MPRSLPELLEERWAESLRLYREGAVYSAFARLGEIYDCLKHEILSEEHARKWSATIQNVLITDADLQSIRTEAVWHVERLRRVLGVGSKYTYEEILWAITIRVELELVSQLLAERGIDELARATSVDNDLLAVAMSPVNASAFRRAQAAAKKNWGIPVHSRWLEDGVLH